MEKQTIKLSKEQKIILIEVLKAGEITQTQSEKLLPLLISDPFAQIRKNSNIKTNGEN